MSTSIGAISWLLRADSTKLASDFDAAKGKIVKATGGSGGLAKAAMGALGGNDLAGLFDSTRATGSVRLAAKALTDPLGAMTAVLSKLGPEGELAAVGVEVLSSAFTKMIALAGAANPYEMQRYNEALADLNAVLGRPLVPVLQATTEYTRIWADALSALLPTTAEAATLFSGLNTQMAQFRDLIAGLTTLLNQLRPSLLSSGPLGQWLDRLNSAGSRLAGPEVALAGQLGPLAIIPMLLRGLGVANPMPSSLGAGQQSRASFMDLAGLEHQGMLAAFEAGGGQTVAQQQLQTQQQSTGFLQTIAAWAARQLSPGQERATQGFSGGST